MSRAGSILSKNFSVALPVTPTVQTKSLLPSFENFEVSTLSERSHEAMHINITFAEMIVPCPTSSSKNWSRVENHGSGVMGLSGQLVSVVSANQDTKMMWG